MHGKPTTPSNWCARDGASTAPSWSTKVGPISSCARNCVRNCWKRPVARPVNRSHCACSAATTTATGSYKVSSTITCVITRRYCAYERHRTNALRRNAMPTATIAFARRPQHPVARQGKLTRYSCRNLYVFEKNLLALRISNYSSEPNLYGPIRCSHWHLHGDRNDGGHARTRLACHDADGAGRIACRRGFETAKRGQVHGFNVSCTGSGCSARPASPIRTVLRDMQRALRVGAAVHDLCAQFLGVEIVHVDELGGGTAQAFQHRAFGFADCAFLLRLGELLEVVV